MKNHYTDAGFALKKAFIDNQSQCKKLFFFYFPFFPDRLTLQILEKSMLLEIKLVWPKVQSEKQTVGKTSKIIKNYIQHQQQQKI